ncbi:hypothetical protein ACIG87_02465 [Micromonospora sp. NPDC051925]|uniref:hypothetical protein n=1 Tax=Micromonospora sp. NPDC051925 TaxID=3364288 RepID=UPI0037C9CE34
MMHLAYLDAGSGSLIVQAVVGGTAGAAVAAKLYWRRLASRFRRQATDPTGTAPPDPPTAESTGTVPSVGAGPSIETGLSAGTVPSAGATSAGQPPPQSADA